MKNEELIKKKHGGLRPGSGRKKGSGLYGETTSVMRIPQSRVTDIKTYLAMSQYDNIADISLSPTKPSYKPLFLFGHKVPAGFPSPADVRIKGDSMIDAGINDNDIVIVDRSTEANLGDIVLASVDGNFTVKTLSKNKLLPRLLPANDKYKPILITENMQFEIWGVITGAVRKFK